MTCPTDIEINVANMISLGLSSKAIAKALGLTVVEVSEYRKTFNQKCAALASFYAKQEE